MAKLIMDKDSIEWIRIKQYCENRLVELRLENDDDLDEIETSRLRGQISMCLEIKNLDEDDPIILVPDTEYLP